MWLEHVTHLWGAHIAVIHGLGLLHAVHAVLKVRSPQGAIGWALALVSFPYAAVPLYWDPVRYLEWEIEFLMKMLIFAEN